MTVRAHSLLCCLGRSSRGAVGGAGVQALVCFSQKNPLGLGSRLVV